MKGPGKLYRQGPVHSGGSVALADFQLPAGLEATRPPEARGLDRDQVRLLVSHHRTDRVIHARFYELADFLSPGDVLVINTSRTMNAALKVTRQDGTTLQLHLSTRLQSGQWVVELREPHDNANQRFYGIATGDVLTLPGGAGGAYARIERPYANAHRPAAKQHQPGDPAFTGRGSHRLWIASLYLPLPWQAYLDRYGSPIRYAYTDRSWPLSYYQTVFATETGSAEMPSAGRAFTHELITHLIAHGVQIAPLLLHTGVASLESNEPPYGEYYRVPQLTAGIVNSAKERGSRVIAVGTTVVRALETTTDDSGRTRGGQGWTDLFVEPGTRLRSVKALLTGFHEPRATHLYMLEALAGRQHLRAAYRQAVKERYLWHEFGDLHLILP